METLTTEIIKKEVDYYFGFDIARKTRLRQFIDARSIYYKLSRDHVRPISYSAIGEKVKVNHATVMHGIKTIENIFEYNQDPFLKENFESIEKNIMPNNFNKYLTKEDQFQNAVMQYFKMQYPDAFVIHCPNEGKRTPFERFKFKKLGGVAGVPDVLCFDSKGDYNGLAIELKIKPNKPTENQQKCLKTLENKNWKTVVSYDFDECKQIIDEYFGII
jgi:hypothetical protein